MPSDESRRPLILVAPRWEVKAPTLEHPEPTAPEETIANVFVDAIIAAGGMPLLMPLTRDRKLIDAYVAMADGVAIPGGQDVDPARWGEEEGAYPAELLCPERDAFEFPLVESVLAADKPLFTTCRGTQLLNVALGGTLDMDAPHRPAREGMVSWRHTGALLDVVHPVEVEPDSLLQRALAGAFDGTGADADTAASASASGSPSASAPTLIQTNSSHHCCVDRLGDGVRLVARATDGMPEAIEVPGKRFVLGVQWHPEYTWRVLETDFSLWKAFVAAAALHGKK